MTSARIRTILDLLDETKDTEPTRRQLTKRQIIIGERGWVWCGDVHHDGKDYVIENASNIRVWGTKTGLGQLALEGRTATTVLDPCGTVRVPDIAVIAKYDVKDGVNL